MEFRGRSVSSDQSNTVTFHIWQLIAMVTCAKLQQSCQSSLYRELSELIREKAFCQPSACKSQSLPNLPLFNIFDHFDSLFSLLLFLRARRRFYRLWSFCFIIGPACRRVDFIFDSSTGYNCARLLALPHLKKRKKRRYFFASCWFSSRLHVGTSLRASQVSLKAARFCASEHRRAKLAVVLCPRPLPPCLFSVFPWWLYWMDDCKCPWTWPQRARLLFGSSLLQF